MARIICELPNAGSNINGIEFEAREGGGVISKEDVPAEIAERFAKIPGYRVEVKSGRNGDSEAEKKAKAEADAKAKAEAEQKAAEEAAAKEKAEAEAKEAEQAQGNGDGEPKAGDGDEQGVAIEEMTDEQLAEAHEKAFGKKPQASAKRDTIINKLKEADQK